MAKFCLFLSLLLVALPTLAQSQAQVDSILVADWHFDEPNANSTLIDSAAYDNYLYPYGPTVVPGVKGLGRSFNGAGNYMYVGYSNLMLNFAPSQSFRIDFSFKTTARDEVILRKGLAPQPGYMVSLSGGRLVGQIGNQIDGHSPDTILTIWGTAQVNDNVWHRGSFVRNRMTHKLQLFVDNVEAAPAVDDNVEFPLTSDATLLVGKWDDSAYPWYYQGQLDEIRIVRFFPVLSDTQSVWHFDEASSGTATDASPYHNTAQVVGTSVVPGISGNARSFNGSGDCMWIPDVESGALDFGLTTSFTIEAWFKTASTAIGRIIVEKGVITQPGFSLQMDSGKAIVIYGNTIVGTPPDEQLVLRSSALYNDNKWHLITFVRDYSVRKLFLYVDGMLAAPPLGDNFAYACASDRPMTIGRWEEIPYYWTGIIDEVAIYRGARHPSSALAPHLALSTDAINFGRVLLGDSASAVVQLSNIGLQDTLRISEMEIQPPFSTTLSVPLAIAPRSSVNITFKYRPTGGATDTLSFLMATNDPDKPSTSVHLRGTGVGATMKPTILSVTDIPNDQGHEVRLVWLRSTYDGTDSSQTVIGYDVWRRVDSAPFGGSSSKVMPGGSVTWSVKGVLWDFVGTIPPVGFTQYSYVAPTLYDSTILYGMHQSVFMISARTNNELVYFSDPDSGCSLDNLVPQQPGSLMGSGNGDVQLQWNPPTDPDFMMFEIYRGTQSSFVPGQETKIGTSRTNNYKDASAPNGVVYYCVAALDSSGNRSAYSQKLALLVTGVSSTGDLVPHQFALYQSYPNPFNPSTQIKYDVPSHSHVLIRVFDMLGRQVATLVNEEKGPGQYTVTWNAKDSATGIYWYRMEAGTFSSVQKMLLLK